jgi:flagellar protein FlgJ
MKTQKRKLEEPMPAWTITLPFADADMQRKVEWVAMMMSASESTATRLKVTPEAIVAQAALESGWGAATVGRFGLFGIKADASWKGERALCRTREFINGE